MNATRPGAAAHTILSLLSVFLLLCPGCGGTPENPIIDRLRATADDRAVEVAASMLGAYGGYDVWRQRQNVEYTYRLHIYGGHETPQFVAHQLHRLGRHVLQVLGRLHD